MNSNFNNQSVNIIKINIQLDDGQEFVLSTYPNEYRSLMHLLKNNTLLDDFGECGGEERCSTCIVELISGNSEIEKPTGKEINMLLKNNINDTNSRLACQIILNFKCDGLTVKL